MAAPATGGGRGNNPRMITNLSEFDHPDSAWNRAIDTAAHAEPFCCRTEWQLSFHETFAPGRQLWVAHDDDSVVALARHAETTAGPLFEPIESSWLFGCPLLGPGAVPMLARLLESHPHTPVVLSGIDLEGEVMRQIVATFEHRYDILHIMSETACRADLSDGFDCYLSRRSAKLRRSTRNSERRANERGVSFERHAAGTSEEVDAVYARIQAVEQRSWKGIGKCGMNNSPSREFYAAMLHRMAARRTSRVIFARHEDSDIGFILGGLCDSSPEGSSYRGQQFSFDDEWRSASIGSLLQMEQLRWLCEEGVARYDMGPAMDYKHHWAETQVRFDAIALRPA